MENDARPAEPLNGAQVPSLRDRLADSGAVSAALNRAAREAVLDHARAGNPVATMRDGKVVWLQPGEVFALVAELDRTANGEART